MGLRGRGGWGGGKLSHPKILKSVIWNWNANWIDIFLEKLEKRQITN